MKTIDRSPARAAYAAIAAEVLPVEAHATHSKPRAAATDSAAVMPVSLKEPVGFMPWCLASSQLDPNICRAARKLIKRGVALAQRNDLVEVVDDRQQVAEAPYTALVDRHRRGPALLPEVSQSARIG